MNKELNARNGKWHKSKIGPLSVQTKKPMRTNRMEAPLQGFGGICQKVHFWSSQQSVVWDTVTCWKSQPCYRPPVVCQTTLTNPWRARGKRVSEVMRQNILLSGLNAKCCVWWKQGSTHHCSNNFLMMKHGSGSDWDTGQDWWNNKRSQIQRDPCSMESLFNASFCLYSLHTELLNLLCDFIAFTIGFSVFLVIIWI